MTLPCRLSAGRTTLLTSLLSLCPRGCFCLARYDHEHRAIMLVPRLLARGVEKYTVRITRLTLTTPHQGLIPVSTGVACLLVCPLCPLLYNFIPDQHAYARTRCKARTNAVARRPPPAAALRARPLNGVRELAKLASTRVVNTRSLHRGVEGQGSRKYL
eukprot:6195291-Pleurochrysis_carterae.AAC.2